MISIVISTSNRADDLAQTLQAIGQSRAPDGVACELIVVDNGSTDRTAEVVRLADLGGIAVRYLREERRGKSFALNSALAASRGDILLFTDDDVLPMPGWIAGMIAPIGSGEADCVAGGVKIAPHLDRPWMSKHLVRGMLADTVTWSEAERRNPSLVGANMAFSRSVLARVPGFDTNLGPGALGLWDDTLFGEQLKEAGFRVRSALEVVVEHHFDPSRLSRRSLMRHALRYGNCQAYIRHHWYHRQVENCRLHLMRSSLRLAFERMTRPGDWRRTEGISTWECERLQRIGLYRGYLALCHEPRRYAKQGLAPLQ